MRGATADAWKLAAGATAFQSTRPVRGATSHGSELWGVTFVSIHAPRAGRDWNAPPLPLRVNGFNPRAPCGARPKNDTRNECNGMFQSTRPVRGATTEAPSEQPRRVVSIHAPRAGRDVVRVPLRASAPKFQSTRPRRGATTRNAPAYTIVNVSIHAPRTGRDTRCHDKLKCLESFNPRAPCGARRSSAKNPGAFWAFQSTRPVRGATSYGKFTFYVSVVSIHAPRAGRD